MLLVVFFTWRERARSQFFSQPPTEKQRRIHMTDIAQGPARLIVAGARHACGLLARSATRLDPGFRGHQLGRTIDNGVHGHWVHMRTSYWIHSICYVTKSHTPPPSGS